MPVILDPDAYGATFASLDGNKDEVLFRGRFYTVQYASGWLLADRGGSLLAWRFDPSSGKIPGDAVQVVDKIASDDISWGGVFSLSTGCPSLSARVGCDPETATYGWMEPASNSPRPPTRAFMVARVCMNV
jgi:hypothetical protein